MTDLINRAKAGCEWGDETDGILDEVVQAFAHRLKVKTVKGFKDLVRKSSLSLCGPKRSGKLGGTHFLDAACSNFGSLKRSKYEMVRPLLSCSQIFTVCSPLTNRSLILTVHTISSKIPCIPLIRWSLTRLEPFFFSLCLPALNTSPCVRLCPISHSC